MEDLEEEVVERIIREIDENGDNYIDEREFIKFLNNLSREFDESITPPLSFLSGDLVVQPESPSIKGSESYKFDQESTTNIQTEASENSAS